MRAAALRALLALAAAGLATSTTFAAPRPDPSCSWSPAGVTAGAVSTMTALDLPPNKDIAITTTPNPSGTTIDHDGSFVLSDWTVWQDTTLYVWTRGGGGKDAFKPGAQLNDYHAIAICSVEVF